MAFIRVEPVQVHVRTDWFSGRPREAAEAYARAVRLRPSNDLIRRFSEAATRQAAQAPKRH